MLQRASKGTSGLDRIEQLCVEKNMRMTDQRRIVARVLSQATDHPDVEELYRRDPQAVRLWLADPVRGPEHYVREGRS